MLSPSPSRRDAAARYYLPTTRNPSRSRATTRDDCYYYSRGRLSSTAGVQLFQEGALYPKLRPDFISLPRAERARGGRDGRVDTPISCDAPTRTRAPRTARARARVGEDAGPPRPLLSQVRRLRRRAAFATPRPRRAARRTVTCLCPVTPSTPSATLCGARAWTRARARGRARSRRAASRKTT